MTENTGDLRAAFYELARAVGIILMLFTGIATTWGVTALFIEALHAL